MNASIYWEDVPMEQKPKMHYYNVPCDIDPESPFNPLNIVKKIYRRGNSSHTDSAPSAATPPRIRACHQPVH